MCHASVNSFACVSYQWECMGDFAIRGELSSKAVGRKELVTVVVLDYLSHCFQGHGICIHLVWTHIVEGRWLGWVTLKNTQKNQRLTKRCTIIFLLLINGCLSLCTLDGFAIVHLERAFFMEWPSITIRIQALWFFQCGPSLSHQNKDFIGPDLNRRRQPTISCTSFVSQIGLKLYTHS